MNQIDSTTIYLFIVFILPGFLSYLVSTSLYRQGTQDREIEVTYKSLLNSASIYAVIYIGCEAWGLSPVQFFKTHAIYSLVIMILASLLWGIIIFKFKEKDYLYGILSKARFLSGRVQPPNLYAALLDPKYQPRAAAGYWIIFGKNGVTHEGYVKYTDVAGSERLAYVTEVKELDPHGNVAIEHPTTYGMVVDLTKLESLEIVYGD